MSAGYLSGDLAFSEQDGIICTSGLIDGRVALYGPLSANMITLGVGLRLEPGTRHWLSEVETGNVGVFLPGDDHDSIYTAGSMYSAITLTAEKLEEEAAKEDLVLDRGILGGTGVHARNLAPTRLLELQRSFQRIHDSGVPGNVNVGRQMLDALILHLARPPHCGNGGTHPRHHGKIVERARAYIQDHLCEPMSVDEIAAAAYSSRRTLFRAFEDVLGESPRHYVRRLRLHRIRHDLASEAEKACTIALIANQWGMSDLGRMSGWYRELFGEKPSETVAGVPKVP
ncbi:AraC-like DNA-binding protein [Bradyrhizobium sp. F1.4.3]|uniref:AraC family transcriptional regulator n=1 Tax=Bradyrhizobium sp. F1.4.3 TaxID=3156356 RepID=UPI003394FBFC